MAYGQAVKRITALLQDKKHFMHPEAVPLWWIFDDGNSPVKFDKVPLVVQENCCLLWLNCMPHGGAEPVSLMAEESPVLSDEEKVNRIIHDLTINDDCAAKGFRPWMVWMLAS